MPSMPGTIGESALARRRRQRAQSTPSPYGADSSSAGAATEQNDMTTPTSNNVNDVASMSTAHSDDFLHIRSIRTVSTPHSSQLMQENAKAAEEAALVLASVQKSNQKRAAPALAAIAASASGGSDDDDRLTMSSQRPVAPYESDQAKKAMHSTKTSFAARSTSATSVYDAEDSKRNGSALVGGDKTMPLYKTPAATTQLEYSAASISARSQRVQERMAALPKPTETNTSVSTTVATVTANPAPPLRAQLEAKLPSRPAAAAAAAAKPLTSSAASSQAMATGNVKLPPTAPAPSLPLSLTASGKQKSASTRASRRLEEEEIMAEDTEPLVPDALLDACCFQTKQSIMLRAHALPNTIVLPIIDSDQDAMDATSRLIEATGLGLGRSYETWTLYLVAEHGTQSTTLRYGDTVCLLASTSSCFLGVKPAENEDHVVYFQAGCFRANPGNAERWMLLRPPADGKPIRVGRAAVEAQSEQRRLTAPIRSGDGIVLRSCQMGGVISVRPDGRIDLMTDSYDSDTIRHGLTEEASLLARLQRHTKLVPSEREIIHLVHLASPPLPSWLLGGFGKRQNCINGSLAYLHDSERHGLYLEQNDSVMPSEVTDFQKEQLLDPHAQELLVMDELLASFMGLEGTFIRVDLQSEHSNGVKFRLIDSDDLVFDVGVRGIVEELLSLAVYFAASQNFVALHSDYRFGTVMLALCYKIDSILQEYLEYISSLQHLCHEAGGSLRNLQVKVRPTENRMYYLHQAIKAAQGKTGGALLNALHRLRVGSFHGNVVAEQLATDLLEVAATPYLRMICRWVEFGELDDPYDEFMVRQTQTLKWEDRYSVVASHVLDHLFTTKSSVDLVLNTGRYWNVVNSEEESNEYIETFDLSYSCSASDVSGFVKCSYQKASELLVRRLLHDHDFMSTLRLLKRYFLLDQGDFFVNFMDAAEAELLLELNRLCRGQIDHWFSQSVQLTEHGENGMEGRTISTARRSQLSPSTLRCRFESKSLVDALDNPQNAIGEIVTLEHSAQSRRVYGDLTGTGLSGMDTFVISAPKIPFPASLVLNSSAMSHYQLVFRHLFFAKHVERRLVRIWQDHQAMKELQSASFRGLMGPTFLLRARMLHFVQNLIYYLVVEVVDVNWAGMEASIASSGAQKQQTIDDILSIHQTFLNKTLEACLLTNKDLLRALTKTLSCCLMFGDQMDRFMDATRIMEDRKQVATEKRRAVRRSLNGSHQSSPVHGGVKEERALRLKRVRDQTDRVRAEADSPSYRSMVAHYSEVFGQNLSALMAELERVDNDQYTPRAMNLALRLDFDGMTGEPQTMASHCNRFVVS